MQEVNAKLLNWASIIDQATLDQAAAVAQLPFIYPHVALMPDAHVGLGATVGSVIPALGAVIPAAVGVDIGCGMVAVRTQHKADQLPADLKALREAIEAAVPVSPGVYNERLTASALASCEDLSQAWTKSHPGEDGPPRSPNWRQQLGSLGGGNHFIEVSLDEEDRVWLFLHSGSRGVGNKIATQHIQVARSLMKRWWIELEDPDLAYLVQGTEEFWAYIRELRWAQDFALANRAEMMNRVVQAFTDWIGEPVERVQEIQCHHNYTVQESHHGKKVWVSRKGAIDAHQGVWGLIPGSMGTASYVVQGKGSAPALYSAPHGAGRAHSRSQARQLFTQDDLRAAMAGIEFRDGQAFIDEIPAAYKDISTVMADAAPLVDVRHVLRQIVNVKGE
ncbi:MAG: RtcB family protein [Bifidobacteriaceae bacterium]|jgi:tRNA-splicing ligase RtcB|nr:RtcB family protein [Bifidobacteriaceae bacterium]